MYLKKFRIGPYELAMLGLVGVASLLRFLLIRSNWPVTNSDEATIDLMALHIAFRGEHPIFYYGQYYMGPFEAYLGAVMFRLFGVSVFTLRLGLVLLFALFLICIYYLTSALYSKRFALFTVGLLSLGTIDIFLHQLKAIGGYPETLLCAAFISLLVARLTLSSQAARGGREEFWRALVYALLGFTIGLAIWTDQLILPVVAAEGLLLLLFCSRDLLRWGGLCLLLGVVVGALPLIAFNLHAPPEENSLVVLYHLQHAGAGQMAAQHIPRLRQLVGSLLYALPAISGLNPLCPPEHLPLFEPATADRLSCTLFHGSWALGYLILWSIAGLLAVCALWRYRRQRGDSQSFEKRQDLMRQWNRLMLLAAAILTLLSYTLSPQSALVPGPTSRYLICMLIATPAVLWPLWKGASSLRTTGQRRLPTSLVSTGTLLFIVTMFLMGTVRTFADVPNAQAAYQEQDTLISDLLRIGARHIYSDYWTCNRLIFQSREQIICSVLDGNLRTGQDRYLPYHSIVKADPQSAYVFPINSPQQRTFEQKVVAQKKVLYHRSVFDGYIVYLPRTDT